MTRLAHTTHGAQGLAPEKRALANHIQHEIREAKRIKQQLGCTWGAALRLAYRPVTTPKKP
jgi:hypothetical protein